MKGRNDWEIKLAGAAFFVSAWFYILFALFLIASAIFEKNNDFTRTIPWILLELILGTIIKLAPNLIGGMAPSFMPESWSSFSYFHAAGSFILLAFGIFILRVRVGLYKRKKQSRISALVISYFFAIYWVFLFILWVGGDTGPLMAIICIAVAIIFFIMGYFLASKKVDIYFMTQEK